MPVIWLLDALGLLALPALPVLPLTGLMLPALVVPLRVPAGAAGWQTE